MAKKSKKPSRAGDTLAITLTIEGMGALLDQTSTPSPALASLLDRMSADIGGGSMREPKRTILSRSDLGSCVVNAAEGHVGLELDDSAIEQNTQIDKEDFVDNPNEVTDDEPEIDTHVELIEDVYVNDVSFDEYGRPVLNGLSGKPEDIVRLLKEMDVKPLNLDAPTLEPAPKHDPVHGWAADLMPAVRDITKGASALREMLEIMSGK